MLIPDSKRLVIFIFLLSAIGMLGLTLQRIRKCSKEVSIRKVAITALCALLIAILIVAFQAARAALTSPVKNLNAE